MLLLNPVVGSGETHFSIWRVNVVGDAPDGFGDDGEVALAVDEKRRNADALLFGEPSAPESAAQQRGEFPDVVGVVLRDGPSDGSAPVVPDHRGLARAEVTYESGHVVNEAADSVVLDARRLVAQVVAAHVRRDGAEAFAEGRQLMT